MSNTSTPKPLKESLDKKLIKLIGYAPTCLISGAIIGVAITACIYINIYIDFFQGISYAMNQLDNEFDRLVVHLRIVVPPSLFGGSLVGLAIGLITVKIKIIWQKILASSVIGLLVYLLALVLYRATINGSIADGLYYLQFFALQLSLVGIFIGLLVSLLPQPETQG